MNGYKGSLKVYWKWRAYQSLDGAGGCRRVRCSKVELGGGRRRRFWRIKVSPKLQFLVMLPKRLLERIRDAYVRMMLGFARYAALSGLVGDVHAGFGASQMKEYDERVILQIYRAIASQSQLITASGDIAMRSAAGVGEIALQN